MSKLYMTAPEDTEVTCIRIEAQPAENIYWVEALMADGQLHAQADFWYANTSERGGAYAAAQKQARDWAARYKAPIRTKQ